MWHRLRQQPCGSGHAQSPCGGRGLGGVLRGHCMVSLVGFATNADIFPVLVDAQCLVISDELSHASIRFGTRLSGGTLATFQQRFERLGDETLRSGMLACSVEEGSGRRRRALLHGRNTMPSAS
ncbi:hypothetical protein P168DRAFT_128335 [Aspergillus campestris IBT 28561]|uniref:Aminotransferase class I/classII domain-containing protein n=1 Tax=Aspergillus campestris (strain IBT 28561) TaxID=1392248 RepID=A0A2I1D725_ASPC2|nr:uncharacterized protein P168DRAFT_128335 [Aspergillus campestris IBT 28561]PKY05674.1 hypothetical protein P168DRAFT_128335 [Aspergillus campestris IBT 28561]